MAETYFNDLVARIAARLTERGETLSVCESSAGGHISANLLAIPGASRFFIGGLVVYTVMAREALLGIKASDMHGIRPATEPYAALLADRCRERLETTWALSETGATGPTGNRYGDPAGHACFAISGAVNASRTLTTGQAEREGNMAAFARAALQALEESLAMAAKRAVNPTGGAVSLMITKRQRTELLELGYSEEVIRGMTPAEAHTHLGIAGT